MGNRTKATEFILKYIDKIAPGGENLSIYKDLLSSMSDKEFDLFILDLESGKHFLTVTVPNFSKNKLSTERNLKIADELGHNFFEKLWIEGEDGMPTYLTPIEYLVVDLPLKRASQMLTKKISVPDNRNTVDALTGQPTGASKGARISYPELQVCAAMGMEDSMIELMKYRGGDVKGGAALLGLINKYGSADLKTLNNYASGVESTKTLATFLKSMHISTPL